MSFVGNAPFMTAAVGGFDQHAKPGFGNELEVKDLGVQYATAGGRRRKRRMSRKGGSGMGYVSKGLGHVGGTSLGELSHTSRAGGRRKRTRKMRGGKGCHGGSRRRRRKSMRGGSCGCTGGSDPMEATAVEEKPMV